MIRGPAEEENDEQDEEGLEGLFGPSRPFLAQFGS